MATPPSCSQWRMEPTGGKGHPGEASLMQSVAVRLSDLAN